MTEKAKTEAKTLTVKEKAQRMASHIEFHLKYSLGKQVYEANKEHLFTALALAVKDYSMDGMFETAARYEKADPKRIYYLSVEYLIGRSLENNLHNLGIYDLLDEIKLNNPIRLKDVIDEEYDPALGNGGLGRLAACFLDSMATLGLPGYGYGINYQFGLFKQYFENGYQREAADSWLDRASPWQIERSDRSHLVPLYGNVEWDEKDGKRYPKWVNKSYMIGIPYDMPIVGYGGKTVNYLRLFSARSSKELDLNTFNEGGYMKAVEKKIISETVSKVLYPSDSFDAGKELRLTQQYFFVSCAVNDIMRRFLEKEKDLSKLPLKAAIQLNDTHPALTIAELMRILVDEHHMSWDCAMRITEQTIGYTNHTLLPEALEKWPVELLEKVVPRHMQIIYDINAKLIDSITLRYPGDQSKIQKMSLIEEGWKKQVRMANLAMIGSHSINGVAAIHSELVKTRLAPDFYEIWPEKFNNKTNGVTPRRWLLASNPLLSELITSKIGDSWITDLNELRKLEKFAKDKAFQQEFLAVKHKNKEILAKKIEKRCGVIVNPDSIFDAQCKRMHEYKRQMLNLMNIIYEYLRIVENKAVLDSPVTYIFGGKAAPSYESAKLIIKLINNVANVVNNDPRVKGQIRIAFIPDYKVSIAERIFPATDVSEQISTAGFEASGTGNMKFALNGALTVGTLDGANIEIREEVGDENFYLFGLNADEVARIHNLNSHKPWDFYNSDKRIKRIIDAISSNLFCAEEPGIFKSIFKNLMFSDYYLLLADVGKYIDIKERIAKDYKNKTKWAEMAILNVARIGKFSSDRTISEYAKDIWDVKPVL